MGILSGMSPKHCGRCRRAALLLSAAFAAACGSAGPVAGAPPHFATMTVTATAGALQPQSRVVIPAFGTVVFKNGLPSGDVVVQVARNLDQSENCATSLAWHDVGKDTVSDPIPPQAITALCFHDAGSFPFTMRTPSGELQGVIEVGSGR
jgi:hypothetical protein